MKLKAIYFLVFALLYPAILSADAGVKRGGRGVIGADGAPGATGADGNVTFATTTIKIIIPGDVFISSGSSSVIDGAVYDVRKGTFNVIGFDGYLEVPSSAGVTMARLAHSSATAYGASYTALPVQVVITTNSRGYDSYISTVFSMRQDTSWKVEITTIPTSGTLPANLHFNIHGWWNKNTTW